MCDLPCVYNANNCLEGTPIKGRTFNILLLYCWQREYDKRPYKHFQFRRLDFEERMNRRYHCLRDFRTIVNFLLQRRLHSVSISSVVVSNWNARMLQDFVRSLLSVPKVELKLMRLPHEFFVMLRLKVRQMKLRELSLEATPLSERDVIMLREVLLASGTLHTLNVASCSLNQYNFATLADGVYKSSSMRSLNASRILGLTLTLDTEKITSIVGSLLMQNKLVELTMEHCDFVAQDMETVAEYLYSKSCSLRRLRLGYNRIAADGAMYLMRGMASGGKLELLDISGNSIGSHGGEWIAKYFSSCLMLQHLHLNYNEIGAEAINLILLTLKKPCRMKRLTLYGNSFDACTAMIVRRLLDAEVVLHEEIDISYTYDEALQDYRIVPWR
ncbi:CG8197 [Drosophila busckii]|uniref:CG8197 n=1 Tax=Drosophila busckii TaxID=30019 RepID=A0A0M5J6W4_DROBS|nr:NLR family CARD domain-containing protein 3 [Drosophila busckii]ALC40786.1 CG8197 [Drosophila busckii]